MDVQHCPVCGTELEHDGLEFWCLECERAVPASEVRADLALWGDL